MPMTSPRTVEERPAGVAGIDGRVGLQHVDAAATADFERPAQAADDADGDGVVVTERVADGDDPVARLHLPGVAELGLRHLRQRTLLDQLDQRAVGQRIPADDTGLVAVFLVAFLAVELDTDLVRVLDDVVVGQDQPGGVVDDEAGAGARALLGLVGLLFRRAEEAAEQLVALIVRGLGFTIEPGLYFDDFGIRTEINMTVGLQQATVTGDIQREMETLA